MDECEELQELEKKWRNGRWFERLAAYLIRKNRYKIVIKSKEGKIFLLRLFVFGSDTSPFAFHIHYFTNGDDDYCLHDHPYAFWTYVIDGSYWEELLRTWRFRKKGSLAFMSGRHLHRVHTKYAWSILFRGPRYKEWGFLKDGKMVPWQKFLDEKE